MQYELRSLSPEHFVVIAEVRCPTSKVFSQIIEAGAAAGDLSSHRHRGRHTCNYIPRRRRQSVVPVHTYSDPDVLAGRYVELVLRMVGLTR
ncbi:hypothetical protein [Prescottella equi]|uniref:hypothetical protein n=1 Tax=Rhodococcus hoagii TaxID=43767 RepID=UPI00301CBBFA